MLCFCVIAGTELFVILFGSYDSPYRTADLEAALVDTCDFATLKSIARSRPVPSHLRAKIWQVVMEVHFTC